MELWVVATGPISQNGLGLTIAEAHSELADLKAMFPLLPDTPAIYSIWESLATHFQVAGKQAHDAHLVAAMKVHGLKSILTFDRTGFSPYPDIEVVHPSNVAV
jgi:predicted nucleic acid-binding protein